MATHVLRAQLRLVDHVLLPFLFRLLPPGVLLEHLRVARGGYGGSRQVQLCKFDFGETVVMNSPYLHGDNIVVEMTTKFCDAERNYDENDYACRNLR